MKINIILVFDIGKTNKKILLFDQDMRIVREEEKRFEEIRDDDGFPCENIQEVEDWILSSCDKILKDESYEVKGINFSTYGATMIYTDSEGNRLGPAYNYLKPFPEDVSESFYAEQGGVDEFCRKTASPKLGMLNSGLQILWLKMKKYKVSERVVNIMHLPQYLSFLLTGKINSEHTSIGCHTGMWDFDSMRYHSWLKTEKITLPEPIPVETTFPAQRIQSNVPSGVGIHDSSASLVPYLRTAANPFILVSSGTWCINMNPFNHSALTSDELKQDCLAYMSIRQRPVKSSRFFLGHIHDVNLASLTKYFNVPPESHKQIVPNINLLVSLSKEKGTNRKFFSRGIPAEYIDREIDLSGFINFNEAYHRLMIDLVNLTAASIELVMKPSPETEDIFITGGFARNPLFVSLLATRFNNIRVQISEIPNATSMGAALVIWETMNTGSQPALDLGLKKIEPIREITEILNPVS